MRKNSISQKHNREVRRASQKLLEAMAQMALIRATHPELVASYYDGKHQYFWPVNAWLHEIGYDLLWYLNWYHVGDQIGREASMPLVAYLMACVHHYEHWEEISLDIHPEKSWDGCYEAVEAINDMGWAAPHDDAFFEALKCLKTGIGIEGYYPPFPPAQEE